MAMPLAEKMIAIEELATEVHRHMFTLVSNMRRQEWDRSARGELTLVHISVLHHLSEHNRERITKLALAENVSVPTMSKAVMHLVNLGLVRRVRDLSDYRGVRVEITRLGRAAQRDSVRDYLDMIKATLHPSQMAALYDALDPFERLAVAASPVGQR